MKIVLIGPAYPFRGGIAHFLTVLYGALKKAGHDVSVHRFSRQYPKFLFPGKTQEDESGVPFKVDSIASLNPLNPFNWPVAAWRISREKPDLVITMWWMPFFGPAYTVTLWFLKLFCKTKVMHVVHNAVPHEKRPGDMFFTTAGFRVADYFLVMSDAVKRDVLGIKPDAKYVLTPHPLYDVFGGPTDKDAAKKALGISGPVVLFFGYIRAYKGLHVLLDATALALKDMGLTLLVAGEFYEDREAYERQVDSLGISGHVVIVDRYIANESVGEFFSAADLLVLPYLTATQSGIAQIGYAFDLPVVATNVGGLPDVVKDGATGYIVPPGDPGALAGAFLKFFKEADVEAFRKNIETERRRFSVDVMVEAIEGLIGGR